MAVTYSYPNAALRPMALSLCFPTWERINTTVKLPVTSYKILILARIYKALQMCEKTKLKFSSALSYFY